eukprot:Em0011g94a
MNGKSRSFQASWLERYNRLVYSESEDGGYCKFCIFKTIQNELITICGDLLLNAILKKVRLLLTIFSQSLKPGSYSHNFFEVRHMMVQELWQVHQKELLLASLQVALAHGVEIEESCPRIASYQLHQSNTPAVNASQYYRRTLTIPMLDHLITELDNRFEEAAAGIVGELAQILPSELVSSSVQLNPSHFKEVLQLYKDDLPSVKAFHSELDLWRTKWKSETVRAKQLDTPTKALSFGDKDYFPNIYVILVISATLPVTNYECERSISMLKLLKTSLRSTMANDRLNGLALMLIHRDVELNPDAVVEEFSHAGFC